MLFTGVVDCKDKEEYQKVLNKLKGIQYLDIDCNDLTIIVEYTPSDRQTSTEEKRSIAMLKDIINSVEIHGYSLIN